MKEREEFKGTSIISAFPINKTISNDEALQMVYKDFSKKIDFINETYPYVGGKLYVYDLFYKHFSVEMPNFYSVEDVKYLSDTFEESQKAFDDGIFNVEHIYFGRGEWPIILMRRFITAGDDDWICYQISR